MVKPSLTDKQRDILAFVETRMAERGSAPTLREIGAHFGISSTNGVRTHLDALIRKGYLKKAANLSRGLVPTHELATRANRVPIVGRVPAGVPIDAAENVEGEVAVDESFLPRSGEMFSLVVDGMSMRDAGILDGDLVVVRKQATANKGDIVVAIVNGEATVKRYQLHRNAVRLLPENPDFEPITVSPGDDFRIAGVVVSLTRKLG